MADIQLVGVSKRFGSVSVIERLSLSIHANEFIVFLGPSGCGKSTLLRMIAGLESVDEGEILLGGQRIDHLPPGARGVAMVFQQYALYPHMTIYENMAFGLRNIGMPAADIDVRVRGAADILEIGELLERKPGQLSGGQRQRVAIGRAIVKEPKAFLFDEPLSNLDAALRARTRVELAQLHNRVRSTMIFVTHDQIEAMTLADRIVVMNRRRIEQIGTPIEIYSRPATKFVASFVGSPTMNFVPVRIAPHSGPGAKVILPDGTEIATRIALNGADPQGGLTFGIRSEAATISLGSGGDTPAKAEVIERLGDRTLVYSRLREGTVIVAVGEGNSPVAVGDDVSIKFDGAQGHLFDADDRAYHAS